MRRPTCIARGKHEGQQFLYAGLEYLVSIVHPVLVLAFNSLCFVKLSSMTCESLWSFCDLAADEHSCHPSSAAGGGEILTAPQGRFFISVLHFLCKAVIECSEHTPSQTTSFGTWLSCTRVAEMVTLIWVWHQSLFLTRRMASLFSAASDGCV